jgi:uncharacterized protein (UPF0333 family)
MENKNITCICDKGAEENIDIVTKRKNQQTTSENGTKVLYDLCSSLGVIAVIQAEDIRGSCSRYVGCEK